MLATAESTPEVSVVMPCLNEAETLAVCIEKSQRSLRQNNIMGEIIVADNGSTDGSQAIATRLGARVVSVAAKGYGNALLGGIAAAHGKFIIMGDADDSYDFLEIPKFVEKLREGFDLVMGNRFEGEIKPGAMPLLHKYLGNPVLSGIARLFFHSPCGDLHCGLRGFSKAAVTKMDLRTTGMEFASEVVVKATVHKMNITEVPITLSPGGRSRPPHLRTWRDGWRHLRFLLLYKPTLWKDPVTEKERLHLDRGHVDKKTGQAFDDPKASVDHVYGYESDGKTKMRDPGDNNPHFPTVGE